jgi:deoxycytidine triphosphate deaminase
MILSDRTIREEIDAGRIVIDPFDERCGRRRSTYTSIPSSESSRTTGTPTST